MKRDFHANVSRKFSVGNMLMKILENENDNKNENVYTKTQIKKLFILIVYCAKGYTKYL